MIEKVTMKEAEGALTVVDGIEYVRGLDKDGNPVLTRKEDFAAVLGGLFSALQLFPFMNRGVYEGSLFDIKNAGYYALNIDYEHFEDAPKGVQYGILSYTLSTYGYGKMEVIDVITGKMYYTFKTERGWSKNWRTVNIV